jgi:hypothetical protein
LLACTIVAGCTTFDEQALPEWSGPASFQGRTIGPVTVSSSILSDEEARRVYGVDLAEAGLQAVWLRMVNRSEHTYLFLVAALDPGYFSADEAATIFKLRLKDQDEGELLQYFRDRSIRLRLQPNSVNEGFVLTPRHEGGRYLTVDLARSGELLEFGFSLPVGDGEFDYEALHPKRIYASENLPDLTLEELRARVREIPCCATDKKGQRKGDPLNVVLVGEIDEVLGALARGGWSFTHRLTASAARRLIGAALTGNTYAVAPVSPLYLFGRRQDFALQRARNTVFQRNHVRFWLAPYRFNGRSIWVGQVSRDVGVKLTARSKTLTTHVIDPEVDEAREYLLQSLLVGGAVEKYGFAAGIPPATVDDPHTNLTNDPYFTDGLRLVAVVSPSATIPPDESQRLNWLLETGPIAEGQSDSSPAAPSALPGSPVSPPR